MNPNVYRRPDKPAFTPIRNRREDQDAAREKAKALEAARKGGAPLTISARTECHVTPPDIAARMVEYLGPCGDALTLEPSAGTGNLVAALLDAGQSQFELCAVEQSADLWDAMHKRIREKYGCDVKGWRGRDFLEYAEEARDRIEFSRIIMNPPFSQVHKHITAALSLWGFGGHAEKTIIALVPVTYEHEDAEEMERLPPDTFATAKVFTKIIRFHEDAP